MLPSSSPGPHHKQGAVTSPDGTLSPRSENNSSPQKRAVQLTSRDPSLRPELLASLKMRDFYFLDVSMSRLHDALQQDTKTALSARLPAILDELQHNIKFSLQDAEKNFARRSYATCSRFLEAAKANQVKMLGEIDHVAGMDLPDDQKTALRGSCIDLGTSLTSMMLRAQAQAKAVEEAERKRRAQDSDEESSSSGSPAASEPLQEHTQHTPVRGSRKRGQDDTASPDLETTSPKRQKTEKTPSTTGGTPHAANDPAVTTSDLPPLPALPADRVASPTRTRALSPQPKPRPRSQLFACPADFTGLTKTAPTAVAATPGPTEVSAELAIPSELQPGKQDADVTSQRS